LVKRVYQLLLFLIPWISVAQNSFEDADISIAKSTDEIILDGILNEHSWQVAEKGNGFFQTFPTDSLDATDSSSFMLTYDDEQIYVAFISYESVDQEPIATSLRRDFSWGSNENISVYLDPFNDRTNGFAFQITPYNVQREGLVTMGGDVADDWDNKWYSETKIYDNYWIAEISIPFKSIRYNPTEYWGIQVLRNNLKLNERTSWIQVPLQYRPSDLLYTGKLIWDTPPPEAGTNISLIPYVTSNTNRDFEIGQDYQQSFNTGFDAKLGLTNALNLDLTFNPDFSQVEVDRQVTNLNRFEIFFPERRQFFLENQDLFAEGGFGNSRPFFSRRIGIASSGDGLTRQIPILAGARVSGKIGKDWRIGALNMQTAADEITDSPGQNYSVATFQKRMFERSTIGGILVNRNATAFDPEDTTLNTSAFNRVFGIDYNLFTRDNRWEGDFFYHRSVDPEPQDDTYSHGVFLRYRVREFSVRYSHSMIGENYNAEVGFVPRTGVNNVGFGAEYNFYPSKGPIQRHGPEMDYGIVTSPDFNTLDRDANLSYNFSFLNTAYFEVGGNFNSVTLLNPFDPTRSGGEELPENQIYQWYNAYIFYRSDRRKLFNFFTDLSYGGFFNGERMELRGGINYRYQPYLNLSIDAVYNQLNFPEPYNSTDFYLVGPRMDLTLNTKLFLTTFLQYNNQIDNFNINSRLQWRFKPVSDLFLVYTDNYNTTNFDVKNRALVLKLSYWFNV
jgi:hypothetical protein